MQPDTLSFATTSDLPDLKEVIGPPARVRALELGSEVKGIGYNIFVLGIPDSGRTTLTRDYLRRKAALDPLPDDWCYVNNFDNTNEPRALRMPAGLAVELRKDMHLLLAECNLNIPKVFSSEEYIHEHDRLINVMKEKLGQELNQLEEYVNRYNFILIKTPYGLLLGPAIDGKPIGPEDFEKLTEEQKAKLHQLQEKLSETMQKTLARLRETEQTTNEELRDLDLRTGMFIIRPLIDDLKARYAGIAPIVAYIDQVQGDLIHNLSRFRPEGKTEQSPLEEKEWSVRYEVKYWSIKPTAAARR